MERRVADLTKEHVEQMAQLKLEHAAKRLLSSAGAGGDGADGVARDEPSVDEIVRAALGPLT